MKVSRLLCEDNTVATASSIFEVLAYFEMVFLEIIPSMWKPSFLRSSHNYLRPSILMLANLVSNDKIAIR